MRLKEWELTVGIVYLQLPKPRYVIVLTIVYLQLPTSWYVLGIVYLKEQKFLENVLSTISKIQYRIPIAITYLDFAILQYYSAHHY